MTKTILIVDDEPVLREILRDYFEAHHFKVFEAENGRQALQVVQDKPIECVLSDIRMPKGSGIELAEKLHKMPSPKPKLILMTGYSDVSAEQAQKLGVIKVLSKPFEPAVLLEEVRKVLSPNPSQDLP
ncbi:MAG: response regulator [Bdellovibrionales bacterium]